MTSANSLRLNLGCGPDVREGYVNVDIAGPFAWDLRVVPWPWGDGEASEVLMWHVLEHLPDTFAVLEEVQRVLRVGGRFHGQVPFALSDAQLMHPQHFRGFHWKTFFEIPKYFAFRVVRVRPSSYTVNWRYRVRNLLPGREFLSHWVWNMYDLVDFELERIP